MVMHRFGERLYSGLEKTLRDCFEKVAADIENNQGVFSSKFEQR